MNRLKAYRERLTSRLLYNQERLRLIHNGKEGESPKLVEPSQYTKEAIDRAHESMRGFTAWHGGGQQYHTELKPKLHNRLAMDDPKGAADDIVDHMENYHPANMNVIRGKTRSKPSAREEAVGEAIKGLHFAAHMNDVSKAQEEHEAHGGFFPEEHY
jgi:hypothetical protein